MSIFLIVIGAIVAIAGAGAIGFGIPVKEFSFGNTLISSGSMAVVGGLIVMAIGAVVGRLQRIAEMLTMHEPAHTSFPVEASEPIAELHREQAPSAAPSPTRAKPETTNIAKPAAEETPIAAPVLPNPALGVAAAEKVAPPPPRPPEQPARQATAKESNIAPLAAERRGKPSESTVPPAPPDAGIGRTSEKPPSFVEEDPWHFMVPAASPEASPSRPSQPRSETSSSASYFDTLWPADTRSAKRATAQKPVPEAKPPSPAASEPPIEPVAILKSGVVDGMAYTLYVDGSIEAELPAGTIRFASINELRDHLAKTS